MNDQLLQGAYINWDKIGEYSYLRRINALKDLDYIDFKKSITFFVGENGTGKSTLLEAIAVAWGFNPEGGTKNYCFSTYDSHSELCDAIRLSRLPRKAGWGYSLEQKAFTMWRRRKRSMLRDLLAGHPASYIRSRMGKAFCILPRINSDPMAYISWTSQRRRCHHSDN